MQRCFYRSVVAVASWPTAFFGLAVLVGSCGHSRDPVSAAASTQYTHDGVALADPATAAVANASTQTMGRLMWDQIQAIGDAVAGAGNQTLIVSRDDTIYMGGIPFPFSDAVPKYRPSLAQELFAGRALSKGFCAALIDKLKVSKADAESITTTYLYLIGDRPSADDLADLMKIAQGAGGFAPMELVCTALLGDVAFTTL